MTRRTLRVFELGAPSLAVAKGHAAGVEVAHVADERDDAGDFRRVQTPPRHRGPGNPLRDNPPQIVVGGGVPEATAPEIDAGNLIASRAMALRTLRGVDRRAVLNVRLGVLACVLSRLLRRPARRDYEN